MSTELVTIEGNEAELAEKALAPIKPQPLAIVPAQEQAHQPITPAQARVEAVSNLLHKAYERVGNVGITPEEAVALSAPFGDEEFFRGAGGKENLIYIQHAALRGRLNKVLGVGQWALVVRNKWAEDYQYYDSSTRSNKTASRVYVEAVLVIRGAVAGEAIGDMVYYPHNQATNYGDAYEGAKSAALRRAAKDLGVGLQAWDKAWCDAWTARHPLGERKQYNAAPHKSAPTPPAPPVAQPKATQAPVIDVEPVSQPKHPDEPKRATPKTLEWFSKMLEPIMPTALAYFVNEVRWLLDGETMVDFPLSRVPTTNEEAAKIIANIEKWAEASQTDNSAVAREPEPSTEGDELVGYVKWLGEKTTKNGNVKYSILIAESNEKGVKSENDNFVGTFDKAEYDAAANMKHEKVRCRANKTQWGYDLIPGTMVIEEIVP